MSRPLRIEYPGAWYHIMNRGGRYEAIFEDKNDYSVFLKLLQETIEIFHIKVSAFCLMKTHYHLLIQTPEANISRSMRHINGVYTQRFNKRHGIIFEHAIACGPRADPSKPNVQYPQTFGGLYLEEVIQKAGMS